MAATLGCDTIEHTNGTEAATIMTDGTFYPSGGIVQVKQHVLTSRQHVNTTSETLITEASLSITPKSSSSKIMLTTAIPCIAYDTNTIRIALYRDGTEITEHGHYATSAYWKPFHINFQHLDSPATTSAVTYTIKAQVEYVGQGIWVNYSNSAAGFSSQNDARGTMTAWEIAG